MTVETLDEIIKQKDVAALKSLMEKENLYIKDGKIFTKDVKDAIKKSTYWDMIQLVRKIGLNSIYGAVTNQGSIFFDQRLGQQCTLTGRCTTRHMGSAINECLYNVYELGESTIYGDTDSIYFQIPHELKTTMDKESFIAIADKAGNYANSSFPEFYKNTFNVEPEGSSVIKCSREICAEAALFIKKKRYTALVYDEKHFRYDVDGKVGKLKIMGLDIKRADCPKWVQVKLEETIKTLLADKKSEDEILDFIRGWRNDFIKFSPWKKGIPKRVNKLTYYTEIFNSGRKGVTVPGHTRAAINWNIMKKQNNDMDSMTILDGGKVIVCKLKKNKFNIDQIAYPIDQHNLPKWFLTLPFDEDEMIQVAVDQKLENIFGLLQWDLDSVKITGDTLDLFSLE